MTSTSTGARTRTRARGKPEIRTYAQAAAYLGDKQRRPLPGRDRYETSRAWARDPSAVILTEIRACVCEAAALPADLQENMRAWAYHPVARRFRRLLRRWWALPAPVSATTRREIDTNPIQAISLHVDRPSVTAGRLAPSLEAVWAKAEQRVRGAGHWRPTLTDTDRRTIRRLGEAARTHTARLSALTQYARVLAEQLPDTRQQES